MNRFVRSVPFVLPVLAIGLAYLWDEKFGSGFALFGHPPNYGFTRPALIGVPICIVEATVLAPLFWKSGRVRFAAVLLTYLMVIAVAMLAFGGMFLI